MPPIPTLEKLRLRCQTLAALIPPLHREYQAAKHDTQRHLIETLIGAGLWYLPKVNGLWTGLISTTALEQCLKGAFATRRPSEEHLVPRKIAARHLLDLTLHDLDKLAAEIERRYLCVYVRFHFVTSTENKILVQHQRSDVFENPAVTYERAGVSFRRVSEVELRAARRGNEDVIREAIARESVSRVDFDRLLLTEQPRSS
jgi:hypothetical protein